MIVDQWGEPIRPKVGLWVWPDEWELGDHLQPCDDWSEADFRLKAARVGIDLACKVDVTGRTIRQAPGTSVRKFVRVKITFVGDGEADTETGGWMRID